MHIAVDAAAWGNRRGYGRQARLLFSALLELDKSNHYTFIVDSPGYAAEFPTGVDIRLVKTDQPAAQAASAGGRRALRDAWRMSRALSAAEFDLVVFPTVYTFVPVFSRARKFVFIHDAIPEKFPDLTFANRTARFLWQVKHALARRQADALVTVSEYSRRCLVEALGIDPQRVFVVGEAADPLFRVLPAPELSDRLADQIGLLTIGYNRRQSTARNDDTPRLVVYLGGFGPHKNLIALVDAFAALVANPDYSDCRLVLVGEYQNEVFYSSSDQVHARVAERNLAGQVIWTGFLADPELVNLLNLASVLVLPSWMEGFGLPAIEAAACGCPVIATRASPLPELLGAGGLYFDPHRSDELASALERVLASPELRHELSIAGQSAAARLTWDAAARQLLDLIQLDKFILKSALPTSK